MAEEEDAPIDVRAVDRRLKRDRRRALVRSALLFALGVTLALLAHEHRRYLGRLLRAEVALDGSPNFTPAHPVPDDAHARIDWRAVHGQLLPAWVIARGRRAGQASDRRLATHRAFAELHYGLSPDPNLASLWQQIETGMTRDPLRNAERVDYLLWAYNDYLDRHDIPWRVEANLHLRRRGQPPTLLIRSYEVLGDLQARSGERLRLLRRADLTNVDEGFLGHTTGREEGALVMLDQVLEFSVRHVWPMLHGGLDARLPASERGLAAHVRTEALGALEGPVYVRLNETAVDQQALIEVAASIEGRRNCGNTFRIYGLPWNGLEPPDQLALVEALERSSGAECPEVTLGEAARLLGASERLGETPALAHAVESLTTWVSRAVSVHELRHAADGRDVACPGCPAATTRATRMELSAYLESFRTPGLGYVALLQACSMETAVPDDAPQRVQLSVQPHAAALTLALGELLPQGCSGAIPDDLYARADEVHAQFFGARPAIGVPEGYPPRVSILLP